MKYLKASILDKKVFSDQQLGLFRIASESNCLYKSLGNILRRSLLQDLT